MCVYVCGWLLCCCCAGCLEPMPRQRCEVRGRGQWEEVEPAAGVGLAGILSRTHAHKDIINCACAAKKERQIQGEREQHEQQEVEWKREGVGGRGDTLKVRSKSKVENYNKVTFAVAISCTPAALLSSPPPLAILSQRWLNFYQVQLQSQPQKLLPANKNQHLD